VYGSSADPGPGDFPYCLIGADELTLCETDTGSWSFENGGVCLSRSMCPGMGSAEQDPMRQDLVNANADATAQSVYDYLRSVWGKYTLSGQQDLTWQDNIDQYQRVINDTGRAPAIMGYDFMNYGMWEGNPGLAQTEEAIAHWDRGGLVTFAWHWRDPDASDDTIGEFYSDSTSFEIPLANGQLDTQSASYQNIEYDIDLIATELQKLEDAGVTVLWRPLHEASGGWFWWGRSDRTDGLPAAYAQVVLWRHLYDRLTNGYGLNNLIWVWNGQSAAWYPGDEYVDVVSHDVYDGAQNYESQASLFNLTKAYPHEEKMVAMSENSNIPDPDAMTADGARWLWFVVWNDSDTAEGVTSDSNFWTGEYYNTNAHKVHVYTHEKVITLDELPEF
jgi:mannan endo-1,4-beta-mannosidase